MIPEKNGESIQVLYYGIKGEYQPHYDYFDQATIGGRIDATEAVRGSPHS